ncbi:hypothetical protein [Hyphomonas jannaschiana]|uniref:hypothetical protein n=1 Tax=Hyphomonas jannaschiana TaxID=86 RepID=UPI0035C780D9
MYRFITNHFLLPLSRVHGLFVSLALFILPIFIQPDMIDAWRQSAWAMSFSSTILAFWLTAWLYWPLARLVSVLDRKGDSIPKYDRAMVGISGAVVVVSFFCMALMEEAPRALGLLIIFNMAIFGGYIAINLEGYWSARLGFVPKWLVIFIIAFFAPLGSLFVWEITKPRT